MSAFKGDIMKIDLEDALSNNKYILDEEILPEFDNMEVRGINKPVYEASPVKLHLEHRGKRSVYITADASICILDKCDRCLKDVYIPLEIQTEHLYKEEEAQDPDNTAFIENNILDVDDLIKGEILTEYPVKVLCKEDCKGICPFCGKDLNPGDCGCKDQDKNLRMASLIDSYLKNKEV